MYPYLRYRFGWDERNYSTFMFYKLSISCLGKIYNLLASVEVDEFSLIKFNLRTHFVYLFLGVLFCSIVLSRCLKIHDGVIGAFAASLDTMAVIGLLFATQIWQLYVSK